VAHACNTSYLGGRDQEDHRANSSLDPILKIPRRADRVSQVVEHPSKKHQALSSNHSTIKKNTKVKKKF
jgi:hypothetical protein